ncbi:MAG TPA: LodA/GoxA family CTQ-dependent oxidase, partial [Acidimicrobiia bacterium]|nr:LodA/GoxA family CTQ-dependent oxidase [Acidimicrobiia bacterium]
LASAPAIGVIAGNSAAAAATAEIASVAIHPAIGVARVGNSADSFYFGPEVPGTLAHPPDGFKDASGAIARQAVRFRLYGYDRHGRIVRELTEKDARITWTVSVANTKAHWYDYNVAMDIPTARPVGRRNEAITGDARVALAVAPGPRTIGGRSRASVALDGGTFLGAAVSLGELMVDGRGRLVVLPGSGAGYSPTSAPLTTFSDNNGWADDICDGPVLATVDVGGRTLQASPAWVVVTPPNYGPALASGLVSAYDSARTAWDTPDDSGTVRFATDILPVLTRLVDMQWVNSGFLDSNGWHTDGDYLDPKTLEKLASRSRRSAAARRAVFDQLRDPSYATPQPDAVPQIYGDGVELPAESAYQWLAVTPIQYRAFQRWADGDFVDDRGSVPTTDDLDDLPLRRRPAALDRANLDQCLGGAYHPGIEMPWSLRVPSMWASAGRLEVRATTVELVDYGDLLTPEATLAADGPLAGSGPGDLTRWLGTPWHADAASCRSGYDPAVSPVLPTFWPARIPNHVLRESDYRVVVDRDRPLAERRAAFRARYDWERFVSAPNRQGTLNNMMAGWWKLGMVQARRGPGDAHFPRVLKVESDVGFDTEPAVAYGPDYRPEHPSEFEGTARQ